jgi:hypothetical protein
MPSVSYKVEIDDSDLKTEFVDIENFDDILVKGMDAFAERFMASMISQSPVRSGKMKASYRYSVGKVGKSVVAIVENTAIRRTGKRAPFAYPFALEHSGWTDRSGNKHKPLMHETSAIQVATDALNRVVKSAMKR